MPACSPGESESCRGRPVIAGRAAGAAGRTGWASGPGRWSARPEVAVRSVPRSRHPTNRAEVGGRAVTAFSAAAPPRPARRRPAGRRRRLRSDPNDTARLRACTGASPRNSRRAAGPSSAPRCRQRGVAAGRGWRGHGLARQPRRRRPGVPSRRTSRPASSERRSAGDTLEEGDALLGAERARAQAGRGQLPGRRRWLFRRRRALVPCRAGRHRLGEGDDSRRRRRCPGRTGRDDVGVKQVDQAPAELGRPRRPGAAGSAGAASRARAWSRRSQGPSRPRGRSSGCPGAGAGRGVRRTRPGRPCRC